MRRHRVTVGIPSASMADVAFLLLIFFVCTTYVLAEGGPTVTLPVARQVEDRTGEGSWALHLQRDGSLFLAGRAVTVQEASSLVRAARAEGRVERILLYADRRLPFGDVYPVLAGLRGAEALAVLLIAEPESGAASNAPDPAAEEKMP